MVTAPPVFVFTSSAICLIAIPCGSRSEQAHENRKVTDFPAFADPLPPPHAAVNDSNTAQPAVTPTFTRRRASIMASLENRFFRVAKRRPRVKTPAQREPGIVTPGRRAEPADPPGTLPIPRLP